MKGSRLAVLAAVVLVVALAVAVPLAAGKAKPKPRPAKQPYLALGDSVPFGYITAAGYEYGNPRNFSGYPDDVAAALGLTVTNAACPGETTGSFASSTAPDNGCRAFRGAFPLHVSYTGTQQDFAVAFLKAHRNTKLVTIQLGANDGFILEAQCKDDPTCIANGVPALTNQIATNLTSSLRALRGTGYKGKIVVVNYYSLNYADAAQTQLSTVLDAAIAGAAQAGGASVANALAVFKEAASAGSAGGETCKAGLLNAAPSNQYTCDVHPSRSGHELLAQAVEAALR